MEDNCCESGMSIAVTGFVPASSKHCGGCGKAQMCSQKVGELLLLLVKDKAPMSCSQGGDKIR